MAAKKLRRKRQNDKKRMRPLSKSNKVEKMDTRNLTGIKKAVTQIARHSAKIVNHVAAITAAAQVDPVGSCKYVDKQGQLQCESPVTQSYCTKIPGGHFRENGSCP